MYTANWEKLRTFCQKILMEVGMTEEHAFICADNLVDADLAGIESHGVSRLNQYVKRLKSGVINPTAQSFVVKDFGGGMVIDGNNAMGMVSGTFAIEKCIEKAKENGACFVTVNHSNHYGMAAYYAKKAADAGMFSITATNAPPNLAPWGSTQKYMGTNPIAFGAPSSGEPIILDMAPSVVAMGKIILAAKLGKPIPDNWVLDREGNPTTDPVEGQYGTLLPIGGPKGSGLAIFVEIMCGILAGAAVGPYINHFWNDFTNPQNCGHVFLAVDIEKFIGLDIFKQGIDAMVGEMKSLPKNPGVEEIFMPGEIEDHNRKERKQNGLEISESVWTELRELGKEYQVEFSLL